VVLIIDIYTVKSGDVLWKIASNYGIDYQQIILANQLDNPNQLVVGEALLIPTNERIHIVKSGETLWMIAQRYGSTVTAIEYVNQITNVSQIIPGQILVVPIRRYTIQSGDTLWAIAQKFATSIDSVVHANAITDPNSISVGMILIIPSGPSPLLESNAYITNLGTHGVNLLLPIGLSLTYLCPFSYHVQADGSLPQLNEINLLNLARAEGISPLMVITNFTSSGFSSDLAHTILNSTDIQDQLLTNVLQMMQTKGYKGLNIDFEYVLPEDREAYNQFLERVVSRLHPQGYSVSSAIAPKVRKDQQGLLYEAHDYEAHGRILDFVVLMTYEWGWAGGPPMAIAPLDSVKKVLDYAVTAIPRDKIMMGMPTYGRDWTLPYVYGQHNYAPTITEKQAVDLAAKYGVNIQYSSNAQSPFFHYTDGNGKNHEVWYEDARSVRAKFETAKAYDLRGVSYWVLDTPLPQNWVLLTTDFTIKRL
jgi:spore germination protein